MLTLVQHVAGNGKDVTSKSEVKQLQCLEVLLVAGTP